MQFLYLISCLGELRDEVYKLLLCAVKPPPPPRKNGAIRDKPPSYYLRSIHPAILEVNKQLHREAYSTMIKINRFIHCVIHGITPSSDTLREATRRIICDDEDRIKALEGCAMSVTIEPQDAMWEPQMIAYSNSTVTHYMILGKDCRGLVDAIADRHIPNSGKTLDISVAVAPYLKTKTHMREELFETFFHETALQESLLKPFREGLHGVKGFKITGVDKSVAEAVCRQVFRDRWTHHEAVLQDLQSAKECGDDAFRTKDLFTASQTWETAIGDIEHIHKSSAWENLVVKGKTTFLDAIAELYFLLCLNVVHVQLMGIEKPIRGYQPLRSQEWHLNYAAMHMKLSNASSTPSQWWRQHHWEPSDEQKAKYMFRRAMWLKAKAEIEYDYESMLDATKVLELLLIHAPDDPAVKREMDSLSQLAVNTMWLDGIVERRLLGDYEDDQEMDEESDEDYCYSEAE